MDFVGDVVSDLNGGFKKVGTLLMRACRKAVQDAVDAIVALLGCCCAPIVKMIGGLPKLVQEIFEEVSNTLKEFAKGSLKDKGCPSMILDKLPWDFDESAELPEPKHRKPRGAPEAQVMATQ